MPKTFSPMALREGRIARGLNGARLAFLVGITRQAIYSFEKGESIPKEETLMKIATELRLPLRFFYREPAGDFELESAIFFRERSGVADMAHNSAFAKTRWHNCGRLELTKHLKPIPVDFPRFSFERKDFDFLRLTSDEIEQSAQGLRTYWGLSSGPIVGLTPLLEKKGIVVFQVDFTAKINGFSFYANGGVPYIACSRNVSPSRHRFNLGHEVGHLLMHANVGESEIEDHHNRIEDQANWFAGALLFPKQRFFDEFFSTDLRFLLELKQRWGMSITAIVKRARNLEILTEDEEKAFYYRNPGIRRKEPGDDTQIETPTFQPTALKAVLDANRMSLEDIKFELPWFEKDLSEIFCVDHNVFEPSGPQSIPANVFKLQ